jgi:galactokinase
MESSFQLLFGRPAAVHAEAPGRVNLIGEHTDYNLGYVLPAAIPQRTRVELARRADTLVRLWSDHFPDAAPIEYRLGEERRQSDWADYVRGMTKVLAENAVLGGFDARIASTVPLGSGLSSSASLEIAIGRALREAFALAIDDVALARAGRRAENELVGAPVGIMDQMACSLAGPGAALFLDTRSMDYEQIPLPSHASLLVIHSGVAHRHAAGSYADRRRECEEAAALLDVASLRDVSAGDLPNAIRRLPDVLGRRVRHVVTENQRVLDTVAALRPGDLASAGRLFVASHASMRDDFEISIPEIDLLVQLARDVQGTYGARLTGGGFGGSIVALAEPSTASTAAAEIAAAYQRETGNQASIMLPTHP